MTDRYLNLGLCTVSQEDPFKNRITLYSNEKYIQTKETEARASLRQNCSNRLLL